MRVAYDIRPLQTGSRLRGIGTYTRRLLEHLAPRLEGLVLLCFEGEPLPDLKLPAPPRLYEVPRPWNRLAGWLVDRTRPEVFRGLEELVDLVHFTSPFELDFGWPASRSRLRRAVMVHDLVAVTHPELVLRGRHALLRPVYARMAGDLKHADLLLANSRHTEGEIRQILGSAAPPVVVAPLAAAPEFRPPPPDEVEEYRCRAGLPERFLLFFGGLTPNKNLEGLLEALVDALPPPPLVVAGAYREEHRRGLARYDRRLPLTWLGEVAAGDLPRLYAAATALVVPSLAEGFGLPVLEAMACGTPVVCSRAASLPEVAGEAARTFDPRHPGEIRRAVRVVWEDEELRREMREAGLKRAAAFSWERTAERTLQAYRMVE